jgi:hypothetical protein
MYEPLRDMIVGSDPLERSGASAVLLLWLRHLVAKNRTNALKLLYVEMFELMLGDMFFLDSLITAVGVLV